jgi:hypothetical protein
MGCQHKLHEKVFEVIYEEIELLASLIGHCLKNCYISHMIINRGLDLLLPNSINERLTITLLDYLIET